MEEPLEIIDLCCIIHCLEIAVVEDEMQNPYCEECMEQAITEDMEREEFTPLH